MRSAVLIPHAGEEGKGLGRLRAALLNASRVQYRSAKGMLSLQRGEEEGGELPCLFNENVPFKEMLSFMQTKNKTKNPKHNAGHKLLQNVG